MPGTPSCLQAKVTALARMCHILYQLPKAGDGQHRAEEMGKADDGCKICAGIGMAVIVFEIKGIENNTLPAMKICGLLLLGIMSATTGFLFENSKIKKWNPANANYRTNKVSIISLLICAIMYGLMCVV